jgi:hypothetical protein
MIGLGGAEFRLPLLIGLFGFLALQAVIVNKAMSLAVVITALPARLFAVPVADLTPHWPVVVNLLAGSLAGAWAGASWIGQRLPLTVDQDVLLQRRLGTHVEAVGVLAGVSRDSTLRTARNGPRLSPRHSATELTRPTDGPRACTRVCAYVCIGVGLPQATLGSSACG